MNRPAEPCAKSGNADLAIYHMQSVSLLDCKTQSAKLESNESPTGNNFNRSARELLELGFRLH